MRVLLVGGTGPVGTATIPLLLAAGHEVAVAHGGAHEPPGLGDVEHLHGARDALLADGGPVDRWRPEVVVDTFAGGASAAKADQLAALARRVEARRVVAVSSMDVYEHCVDAGLGDGSGTIDLPRHRIPLGEDSARRAVAYPGAHPGHDNVAMEDALGGAPSIAVLRPGAIYGPHPEPHPNVVREWFLVGKVHRGEHRLALPDGGGQLFHRVALERVGSAVAAAVERAPEGRFPCNVGDPRELTFAGLAHLVGERLGHAWDPERVPWPGDEADDHPWNTRHPVLCDVTRLQTVLGVTGPDPGEATIATVDWMWERREELAALLDAL